MAAVNHHARFSARTKVLNHGLTRGTGTGTALIVTLPTYSSASIHGRANSP
jgi:hypothetical protein